MSTGHARLIKELIWVQDTGYRRVGMLPKVHDDFKRIEKRWKSRLERHFANYGLRGTTMPREHFNSEGRFPTGGKQSREVHLVAFKAYQHRLYGVTVDISGCETFIGLKLITDKKTNRADQKLLMRIAKSFRPYHD